MVPVTALADGAGAALPDTATAPVMPAAAWPGIEQMNVRPPAGIVTVPVALAPGAAVIVVPSTNWTSWVADPVLVSLTWYEPGSATVTVAGSKPRSNAWISMSPPVLMAAASAVMAGADAGTAGPEEAALPSAGGALAWGA